MRLFKIILCGIAIFGSHINSGASNVTEEFDLGQPGVYPFSLVSGFSFPETTHRWTEGEQALIRVTVQPVGKGRVKEIVFENTSALINSTYVQTLKIFLNGESIKFGSQEELFYTMQTPTRTIKIPFPSNGLPDVTEIFFEFTHACKPEKVDPTSEDVRVLAILFKKGYVTYTKK